MASVWKKGPSWYVKFKDGTGRYRQIRTTAATKTEARRIALELERAAERQRLGLEELPDDTSVTLGELVEWWLSKECSPASRVIETSRLTKHILRHPIAGVEMRRLEGPMIERRLRGMEEQGAAPASVEHVRRKLRAIVNAARAAKKWRGPNPLTGEGAPEPREIPERIYSILAPEEVPLVMQEIAPQWRGPMAMAIYAALRKGEILGMRKSAVDLRAGLIEVSASWDRTTTKGGTRVLLPIARPLRPYLKEALRSPGPLLFPRSDGSMHPRDVDLAARLRTAMIRAGLVEGWDHICRRCKAQGAKFHTWRHPDGESRRCPRCTMRLWPKPIPRPVRWHDLRHTTATILLREGVPIQHVQRLLRHADIRTTIQVYGHMVAEDLREAVDRLPEGTAPTATRLLPSDGIKEKPPKTHRENVAKSGAYMAGDRGFEPLAFGSGEQKAALSVGFSPAQEPANACKIAHLPDPLDGRELQPQPTKRQKFATRLLPMPVPMLSVREVAARLRVSTATVYRLTERGDLPHVRISGAIRIHPEDFEDYLARR